jgi:transcriptional regulator with XRE-family HTH domain
LEVPEGPKGPKGPKNLAPTLSGRKTILIKRELKIPKWATKRIDNPELDFEYKKLVRTVARNVFYLRRIKWLIQSEVAEQTGLKRTTISYIECGLGNPTLFQLFQLARFFQVPMNRLFENRSFAAKKCDVQRPTHIFENLPVGIHCEFITLGEGERKTRALNGSTQIWIYVTEGNVSVEGPTYSQKLHVGESLHALGEGEHILINRGAVTKIFLLEYAT